MLLSTYHIRGTVPGNGIQRRISLGPFPYGSQPIINTVKSIMQRQCLGILVSYTNFITMPCAQKTLSKHAE